MKIGVRRLRQAPGCCGFLLADRGQRLQRLDLARPVRLLLALVLVDLRGKLIHPGAKFFFGLLPQLFRVGLDVLRRRLLALLFTGLLRLVQFVTEEHSKDSNDGQANYDLAHQRNGE